MGQTAAGVEMLESVAERRARNNGVLSDTDLAELGITLEQARTLAGALKSTRAQQPDRGARTLKPKDSPFAALSALSPPPPAPARRKRPRPRRKPA